MMLLSAVAELFAQQPATIFWTGPLKGHVRTPNVQTLTGGTGGPSRAYSALAEMLAPRDPAKHLLLGLGSNFAWAPEATWMDRGNKSRYYWVDENLLPVPCDCRAWVDVANEKNPPCDNQNGKADLTQFDIHVAHRGRGTVPYDNVAGALKSLGYNALAVGPDDLAFGPERLRQYARLLHSKGSGPQLLAANLVITVKRDPAVRNLPKYMRNAKSYDDAGTGFPVAIPKAIYPWLPALQWAESAVGGEEITFHKALPGRPEEFEQTAAHTVVNAGNERQEIRFPAGQPAAGDSWAICLTPAEKGRKTCALFTVQYPLLAELPLPEDRKDHPSPLPSKPYFWHKHSNTVVFGIVDTDLIQQVGVRASAWISHKLEDDEIESNVAIRAAVLDPVEALKQAQARFEADHPKEAASATRILLAHMPEEKAVAVARKLNRANTASLRQLATQQKRLTSDPSKPQQQQPPADSFRLVMAVASHKAPSVPQSLTRHRAGWRAVVLTAASVDKSDPQSEIGQDYDLALHAATIVPFDHLVFLENSTNATRFNLSEPLSKDANEKFDLKMVSGALKVRISSPAKAVNQPDVNQNELNQMVLQGMMDAIGADAAILQKSGLRSQDTHFETPAQSPEAALDRFFPQGDMLIATTLTGATIKKLLDRSRSLADEEESIYAPGEQQGRSLLVRGFSKSSTSSEYEWQGEPLQDNRRYKVATSDYLAFGDSAYSDLKPDGPLFATIADTPIRPLSIEVLRAWLKAPPPSPLSDPFLYFDHLSLTPADSKVNDYEQPPAVPVSTKGQAPITTSSVSPAPVEGPPTLPPTPPSPDAPVWRLTFRSVNSFDAYHHNESSESARLSKLFGISSPQFISNPESVKWGALNRFLAERIGTRQTFFLRGEENFRADRIRNKDTNAYARTIPENLWALESGFSFRRIAYDRWAFHPLGSVRYESQLLTTLLDIPVLGGKVDSTKTSALLGKGGFRLERRLSRTPTAPAPASPPFTYGYLETGFLFGRSFGIPSEVAFVGNSPEIVCSLTTASTAGTLEKCINKNVIPQWYPGAIVDDAVDPTLLKQLLAKAPRDANGALLNQQFLRGTNRPRAGIFLDMRLVRPLWHRATPVPWSLVIENRGQLLFGFSGDISTDARYFDTQSFGLQLPILGNLKLLPKMDLLFFRNQVQGATLTGRRFSLSLEYNFERNGRVGWKKALQSPAIAEW